MIARCNCAHRVFAWCICSYSHTSFLAKSVCCGLASRAPLLVCSSCHGCLCRDTTARFPRAQMGSSVQEEQSRGGRNEYGLHLDKRREQAEGRIDCGFAQARLLPCRQKRGGFPSPGTMLLPTYRGTSTTIFVD